MNIRMVGYVRLVRRFKEVRGLNGPDLSEGSDGLLGSDESEGSDESKGSEGSDTPVFIFGEFLPPEQPMEHSPIAAISQILVGQLFIFS